MINVVNVSHHYGLRHVLRHVNLRIQPGELACVMGPNGTGKTTLMQVMAGLLSPMEGYVEINGLRRKRSPAEELEIRRQMAWLPADPWLPSGHTGREWLLANGRVYGVPYDRLMEHIPRLLALFNLEDQADQRIPAYSTGQKKKLALAGALVTEAKILLLDEPFAGGLDPSGILALKRIFEHHRQRRDVTVVMATPVPELVEELADRVAVIRDGRLIAFDSIAGLARQAGVSGPLDQIYERLVSPGSANKIDRYFREVGP